MNTSSSHSGVWQAGAAVVFVAVFFIIGVVANQYRDFLEMVVHTTGVVGMIGYVGITAAAVIAAPLSTFPLVPIAAMMWGSFIGALLSALGWFIGSIVVYGIGIVARPFLVRQSALFRSAEKLGAVITKRNDPLTLIFLRMVLPVDVVSYAFALCSPMPFTRYCWTTAIGILPFAFIFSYVANLSMWYQVIALVGITIFLCVSYLRLQSWYNEPRV